MVLASCGAVFLPAMWIVFFVTRENFNSYSFSSVSNWEENKDNSKRTPVDRKISLKPWSHELALYFWMRNHRGNYIQPRLSWNTHLLGSVRGEHGREGEDLSHTRYNGGRGEGLGIKNRGHPQVRENIVCHVWHRWGGERRRTDQHRHTYKAGWQPVKHGRFLLQTDRQTDRWEEIVSQVNIFL